MEERRLAGREISVVGHGAWVTGVDTVRADVDADAFQLAIRTALDFGVTWIDTAELYGMGRSEELVGRVVAGCRDEVLLATKVAPSEAGGGMRPPDIRRAVHGSLLRLATDRIDLYQLHWYDPSVPLEETWGAMRELVTAGLVLAAGVSNFGRPLIERCLTVGPVDSVQNQLSLLHRTDLDGLLPWLAERAIAYLAYGSLAFGLLSGHVTKGAEFRQDDWRGGGFTRFESNYYQELFAPDRLVRHVVFVEELSRLAEGLDLSLSALALRWVLEQPGVTASIAGSLNPSHIRANARAGEIRLGAAALERIDELLARHGTD